MGGRDAVVSRVCFLGGWLGLEGKRREGRHCDGVEGV